MTNQILNSISIAKESVWGNLETPIVSIPVNFTGGIQVNNDVQILSALKSKLSKNIYATKGNVSIEGDFEAPLLLDNVGHFLLSWFGLDTPSGTGPYTHEFTEDPVKVSYTIEQNMQSLIQRFAGCFVNSLKFTCAVGQPVVVTLGIKGKEWAEASAITPVYSELLPVEFGDGVAVTVNGDGIDELQSLEIELLNNLEMKHTIGEGQNFPGFNYLTGSEVNVSFEGYLNDNSKTLLFDPARAMAPVAFEVEMANGADTLTLVIPRVQLTTAETPIAEDYNKITGEGKALYDNTEAKLVSATLVNDVVSY